MKPACIVYTCDNISFLLVCLHNSHLHNTSYVHNDNPTKIIFCFIIRAAASLKKGLGKISREEKKMSGKVKEVAVEEAERIKTLTSDAVRSGAYLYPLRVNR